MSLIDRAQRSLRKGKAKPDSKDRQPADDSDDLPDEDTALEAAVEESRDAADEDEALNASFSAPEAEWQEFDEEDEARLDDPQSPEPLEAAEPEPAQPSAEPETAIEQQAETPPAPQPAPAASPARSRDFFIDLESLAEEGFVTPSTRRGQISEEIRLIKRRLLRSIPTLAGREVDEANPVDNVIMLTSSEPGEGKTFIALNLALSFSVDEGYDVLIIDADVANPSLSRKLEIPPEAPGLIDLLTDETVSMPQVLHRDENLRISVMGVGTRVPSATELFGSSLMQEFVEHVARRYPDRVIIFDAPPVLASTEPMVLSNSMGHVLLVVAANRTQKDTVMAAIEMLDTTDNVQLVLNRVPTIGGGRFGRKYSGYG